MTPMSDKDRRAYAIRQAEFAKKQAKAEAAQVAKLKARGLQKKPRGEMRVGGPMAPKLNDDGAPDKQLTAASLKAKGVDDLRALAAAHVDGPVARQDGKPGKPTKADYIAALLAV